MKNSQVIQILALNHPDTPFVVALRHVNHFEDEWVVQSTEAAFRNGVWGVCVVLGDTVYPKSKPRKRQTKTAQRDSWRSQLEPLFKWRIKHLALPVTAIGLVNLLSCEGMRWCEVPPEMRDSLTAFRHRTQKQRLSLCENFLQLRKSQPSHVSTTLYDKLFRWRIKHLSQPLRVTAIELADSLSCEGTDYLDLSPGVRDALTAFRHCNQKRRLALCEHFLAYEKKFLSEV